MAVGICQTLFRDLRGSERPTQPPGPPEDCQTWPYPLSNVLHRVLGKLGIPPSLLEALLRGIAGGAIVHIRRLQLGKSHGHSLPGERRLGLPLLGCIYRPCKRMVGSTHASFNTSLRHCLKTLPGSYVLRIKGPLVLKPPPFGASVVPFVPPWTKQAFTWITCLSEPVFGNQTQKPTSKLTPLS